MRQHSRQVAGLGLPPSLDPWIPPLLSTQRTCLSAGADYFKDCRSAAYNVLMPLGFDGLSSTGSTGSLLESLASASKGRAEGAAS